LVEYDDRVECMKEDTVILLESAVEENRNLSISFLRQVGKVGDSTCCAWFADDLLRLVDKCLSSHAISIVLQ